MRSVVVISGRRLNPGRAVGSMSHSRLDAGGMAAPGERSGSSGSYVVSRPGGRSSRARYGAIRRDARRRDEGRARDWIRVQEGSSGDAHCSELGPQTGCNGLLVC